MKKTIYLVKGWDGEKNFIVAAYETLSLANKSIMEIKSNPDKDIFEHYEVSSLDLYIA